MRSNKSLRKIIFLSIVGIFLFANCTQMKYQEESDPDESTIQSENGSEVVIPPKNENQEEINEAVPLAERIGHVQLTSGLQAEYLYRSFLQIPVGMVWGPDGFLYIGDWAGRHIVKASPDGKMEDLGLWKTVEFIWYDGPRGIAFDSSGIMYTNNHGGIYRVDSEGNVADLTGIEGSPVGSIAISASDELFYTDRNENGRLLKWIPNGNSWNGKSEVIIEGIPFAENLVFGKDGTLYLTQLGLPDVLKVDVETGDYDIFAENVCAFDPCFLAVDTEGDIWVRAIKEIHQFSPEGVEKPFIIDGETYPDGSNTYTFHSSAGIAFDDNGGLYVASYNSQVNYLAPVSDNTPDPEFTLEKFIPGFEASDLAISSTGIVYGTDINLGQVLAFSQDGTKQVLLEHSNQGRAAVAVDSDDRLFVGMPYGEILRFDENFNYSHYADITTERMVFGSNGILYAVVYDDKTVKIVGITGVDETFILTTELDGWPIDGETHLAPALDEGLYVISESNRNLYLLDFEGHSQFIADLKSLGGGGVMASSPVTGDVYWIAHGPYELNQITRNGEISKFATGIYGDPWGMIVSQDGKYIYVAESGVIDKLPIANSQE